MNMRLLRVLALFAALLAGLIGYWFWGRPRQLRWGATEAEALAPLPGDDLVPAPRLQTTRAVTIHAPADRVWPWLAQMGWGRGGFYSYDSLENLLGLGIRSTDRILPAYQDLEVGDTIPWGPDGGLPVRLLEPGRVLGLGGTLDPRTGRFFAPGVPTPEHALEASWVFVLQPLDDHSTRLIARARYGCRSRWVALGLVLLLEPTHFVMERRMLFGIRRRAERLAEARAAE